MQSAVDKAIAAEKRLPKLNKQVVENEQKRLKMTEQIIVAERKVRAARKEERSLIEARYDITDEISRLQLLKQAAETYIALAEKVLVQGKLGLLDRRASTLIFKSTPRLDGTYWETGWWDNRKWAAMWGGSIKAFESRADATAYARKGITIQQTKQVDINALNQALANTGYKVVQT